MIEIIIWIVFILLLPFFIYLIRGVPKDDYADDNINGDATEDIPKGMLQEINETYSHFILLVISGIVSGIIFGVINL